MHDCDTVVAQRSNHKERHMGMQQDETGRDGEEGTVECYHVGDHDGRDAV